MKSLESKNNTILQYTHDRVVIKLYQEGTSMIFTRDGFDEFLLFLNYANVVMGKEKALENDKKRD